MGDYLDGQTIIELIKGDVIVDWDMYAHALCGGGGGGSYWSSCIGCVGMLRAA